MGLSLLPAEPKIVEAAGSCSGGLFPLPRRKHQTLQSCSASGDLVAFGAPDLAGAVFGYLEMNVLFHFVLGSVSPLFILPNVEIVIFETDRHGAQPLTNGVTKRTHF